ncbi:MAG: hypothetical protein M1834_002287 [Cirrosporium novae-zelandiae]|nr:MAG: hypothetical protein M1834_002287 [Cirrosporium novae-zelandiae]
MPRSKQFYPGHEPLTSSPLRLQHSRVSGPVSFLNPTDAHYRHPIYPEKLTPPAVAPSRILYNENIEQINPEQFASNVSFRWRSRDNRKGRHTLLVEPTKPTSHNKHYIVYQCTSNPREVTRGIWRMLTVFPYWDISYLVATIFTLGSVVWVINAFFVWLPLVAPSTEFKDEVLTGGGLTAFFGATIFEVGSVLLIFEAVNENNEGCFGWALEQILEGENGSKIGIIPGREQCEHHHSNNKNFVGKGIASSSTTPLPSSSESQIKTWQWFPSPHELRTHYFHQLGFLASLSQLFGATIFWVSGFTALPHINKALPQDILNGIYWVPQIVGGSGFIVSGILFMLETQSIWYIPAFGVLGWHVGFWNLVGAFGFTLCGALGPAYGNSGAQYEASLATFWGSWAFLMGSMIQWYESLDKYPVEQGKIERPKSTGKKGAAF